MTAYIISNGQTSNGIILNYGDTETILSGGIAGGTVVSGGHENISAGGIASGTEVNSSYELILSGGLASGTVISGGYENISAGGIASGTVVNSGYEFILSGGLASGTVVNGGGDEYINSGGQASGLVVNTGGEEFIYSGGLASGTVINSGGKEFIYSGGLASGTVVNSGGVEDIVGLARGTVVSSGGHEVISGGTVSGGSVASGGEIDGLILSSGYYVGIPITIDGVTLQSGAVVGLAVGSGATTQGFVESGLGNSETIVSGGLASGTVVNSGGYESILSEGLASGTVVNSGGYEVIFFGGLASGTVVNSGGLEVISSGGSVNGGSVASGGEIQGLILSSGNYVANQNNSIDGIALQNGAIVTYLTVDSGASTQGFVVSYGYGTEVISSGGFAGGTVLNLGGQENILSGGLASGTVVNSGGLETIYDGGTASGGSVASGGEIDGLVLSSGYYAAIPTTIDGITLQSGAIVGLTVESGATTQGFVESGHGNSETIVSGGLAIGTMVNSSGDEYINSGGLASSTMLNSGGDEYINSGGQASGTVINNGGVEWISAGGLAIGTVVNSGGYENISGGYDNISVEGLASGTTVNSGGVEWIYLGGLASGTVVNSGGTEFIDYGGQTRGTVVNSGGEEDIAGIASGTVVNSGGTELISVGGLANDTVVNSGGYEVIGIPLVNSTNTTLKNGAELIISGIISGTTNTSVSGLILNAGAKLDFTNLTITSVAINSADQLRVSSAGTTLDTLGLSGNYSKDTFAIQSDGSGGTLVTVNAPILATVNYNAASGQLTLTGSSLTNTANGFVLTDLTLKGDGGVSYTLTSGSAVSGTPTAGSVIVQLSSADQLAVDGLFNKNGLTANDAVTTYNLAAVSGWDTGAGAISTEAVTVSHVAAPTLSTVSYNAATGVFTVTGAHLDNQGSVNGIALADLALTVGSGSYHFNASSDSVNNLTAGGFTISLNAADTASVDSLLNANGTKSAAGAAYNLSAAVNWDSDSGAAIKTKAITVSGDAPLVSSVGYNAATGKLSLSGANFSAASGYNLTDFSLTGDGGASYTLTGGSVVSGTPSATGVIIQLSAADQLAVDGLLNKTGTTANDGSTVYNLSAGAGWDTGAGAISSQGLTVSNVTAPTIKSVAYNVATGLLTVTGAHLDNHGSANGIALADLTLTVGSGSYQFNAGTDSVSNLSAGGFTIGLSSADQSAVNSLINDNGSKSLTGTAYKLSVTANWDSDAGAAISAQSVTVSGLDILNSKLSATPLSITNLVEGSGQIELSKTIFTAFAGDTVVTAANFSNAASAAGATDYLYYNAGNGGLYYDALGSGTPTAGVEIAVIGVSSHPADLTVADFKLIA